MLKLFSTAIFAPDGIEADLERRVVSGGTALSGEEDVIATDGGGRWFLQLTEPYLDDVAVGKAWRAVSAYLGSGRPVIVRTCADRYQLSRTPEPVPHSDDTPFSDGTEYVSGESVAKVTANAVLRATALSIDATLVGEALVGGELFGIDHPTLRHRWYRITEIAGATIRFEPPLREAVTAGTDLNFSDPRCVMRLDGDMRSPTSLGFMDSPGARFVEHFPGPGGYE